MRLLVILLLMLVLLGCGGGRLKKDFLALRADISTTSKQSDENQFRIQIKDIEPTRLADNPNVVVRRTDYSVSFVRGAEWAVRPAVVLTEMVEAEINENVPTKAVRRRFSESVPDLLVGGTLISVEDDQRKDVRYVSLKIRLQLIKTRDEHIIVDKIYTLDRPISKTADYPKFAATLNDMMKETAKEFALEVAKAIGSKQDETKHSEN